MLVKDIDFCSEDYSMIKNNFISKGQRQSLTVKEEGSFKKIEVRAGVCAAAILHVRLG